MTLRLLLVEDSETDAQLLERALTLGISDIRIVHVKGWDELETELLTEWDVLVTDYDLKTFSADEVIDAAQAVDPTLPVIVVSGAIGEERVVGLVQRGARDLILKDNLKRLAPAVQREADSCLERRSSRAALLSVTEDFNRIVDTAPVSFMQFDGHGTILEWNDAAGVTFGRLRTEVLGRTCAETLITPEYRSTHLDDLRHFRETGVFRAAGRGIEFFMLRADGSRFPAEATLWVTHEGADARINAFVADLTEVRAAEQRYRDLDERLHEAQRVDSLGILAGGLAHDFNNLLLVMIGHGNLAREDATTEGALHLDAVLAAADRASKLSREMLLYAGQARTEPVSLRLDDVVADSWGLIEAEAGHRTLSRHTETGGDDTATLPPLIGDPTQIAQVLVNLAMNAIDATTGDGEIDVRLYKASLTAEMMTTFRLSEDAAAGDYVCMDVADNGSGIAPDALDRIFDPFFSTKFVGRGLGLAAVLGIIKAHEGLLKVRSGPDGTCFTVAFRVAEALAARKPPPGAGKAVLLITLDSAVAELAPRALTSVGFTVTTETEGAAAVARVGEAPRRFTAAIIDGVLPGLAGPELVAALRAQASGLPIVMLGDHKAAGAGIVSLRGITHLPKPFAAAELVRAVTSIEQARNPRVRVMIVDNTSFRAALIRMLDPTRVEIVGEPCDAVEAILQADDLRPDVILMDVAAPSVGGVDAAEEIKMRLPDTRIILISAETTAGEATSGAAAGVNANLSKHDLTNIREAVQGY